MRTGIPWLDGLLEAAILLLAASTVTALLSLVLRYRRAQTAERKQLQWFLLGAVIAIAGVVAEFVHQGPVSAVLLLSGILALPGAIGVAVLRYRLYEIDRIASRTVSYAVVAGLLAAVYAGGVVGVQAILPTSDNLAVAGSTLAAAALFNPLRRRVQAMVDRRFNRSRYDARRTVETFASRLSDQVDLVELHEELLSVVGRCLEPAAVSLWLRPVGEQS